MKAVGRVGDARATASSSTTWATPAATGTWSAGAVFATSTQVAGSDGKKIITAASCTFTFTGSENSSGAPFTTTSDVSLNPASKLLKVGGKDPLVDGDEAHDSYGNRVEVTSAATWRTA